MSREETARADRLDLLVRQLGNQLSQRAFAEWARRHSAAEMRSHHRGDHWRITNESAKRFLFSFLARVHRNFGELSLVLDRYAAFDDERFAFWKVVAAAIE